MSTWKLRFKIHCSPWWPDRISHLTMRSIQLLELSTSPVTPWTPSFTIIHVSVLRASEHEPEEKPTSEHRLETSHGWKLQNRADLYETSKVYVSAHRTVFEILFVCSQTSRLKDFVLHSWCLNSGWVLLKRLFPHYSSDFRVLLLDPALASPNKVLQNIVVAGSLFLLKSRTSRSESKNRLKWVFSFSPLHTTYLKMKT